MKFLPDVFCPTLIIHSGDVTGSRTIGSTSTIKCQPNYRIKQTSQLNPTATATVNCVDENGVLKWNNSDVECERNL